MKIVAWLNDHEVIVKTHGLYKKYNTKVHVYNESDYRRHGRYDWQSVGKEYYRSCHSDEEFDWVLKSPYHYYHKNLPLTIRLKNYPKLQKLLEFLGG